jgi:hypothetical protein
MPTPIFDPAVQLSGTSSSSTSTITAVAAAARPIRPRSIGGWPTRILTRTMR